MPTLRNCCLLAIASLWAGYLAAAQPPNFIVIFTDDQGYNDLGCFGSPNIQTPNIDRLAAGGMRFTSFYSGASVCTPSRAALLTGCYPERVGNLPVLFPHSDRGLSHAETTIAEMLRDRGYATACIGKWHLGHHAAFLPTEHGFSEYFGVPYSNDMGVDGSMSLAPDIIFREGRDEADFRKTLEKLPPLFRNREVIEWPADQTQLTQRYTEEAVRFIREHRATPFFLYLPHTMPHIPLYASDDFRGQSNAGLYGDTLEEIDWSVGKITDTLRELEIENNTLIVYTSDNGPWKLKGNDTDKVKGNQNRRIGGSAYPLRGHKFSKWEGGMRVPCVMYWPDGIEAGRTCDALAASIDLLPTFAALSGAQLPQQKIDGVNIASLLTGDAASPSPRQVYFYRTNGVRSGQWKFLDGALYDLETDISETTDVAAEHPQKLAELKSLLDQHRSEMQDQRRLPAYHQRDPYPFPGAQRWTVVRGRWALRGQSGVRQQTDWTDSQLLSPTYTADIERVAIEAKINSNSGSFRISLRSPADQQVDCVVSKSHLAIQQDGQTVHQVPWEDEKPAKWHRYEIRVLPDSWILSVDTREIGRFQLSAQPRPRRLALETLSSRVDFRDLRISGGGQEPLDTIFVPSDADK